jgi:hypothetical protein
LFAQQLVFRAPHPSVPLYRLGNEPTIRVRARVSARMRVTFEEERRMPYITSIERSGIRQGLLKGISLGLKLKFGESGLNLLPEISSLNDINLLEAILSGLETVSTVEELRQIYHNTTTE